jgi:hypothetical protein
VLAGNVDVMCLPHDHLQPGGTGKPGYAWKCTRWHRRSQPGEEGIVNVLDLNLALDQLHF